MSQHMKLKLICRFNGAFHASPSSGRLRYTGGETRILWIDRNIVFSSLKSKIAELVYVKGAASFSLFYHLPVPESSEDSVTPVLIASADDVQCMIDDLEKIEFNGKPSRLWLFVCREDVHADKQNVKINGKNLNLTDRSIGKNSVKPQTETPVLINDEHIAGIEDVKNSLKESANIVAHDNHLPNQELQTIENSDLEYIKELGSGTYGIVYYGKWRGSDVAIKKIKPICLAEDALDQKKLITDFWNEAQILRRVQHPNVVALYGVVSDGPMTNWATVIEYMVNGSLKQVLGKKDRTIDRRKRVIIAMDAAFGMEYLHEKNIVHFDLKSHNIFVNLKDPQRPVCKIGDLGLSRIKQRRLVEGGIRGTIRWMAPELLNNVTNQMVSEKIDVYSYGIILWELLTGEVPYAPMRSIEIIDGVMKGCLRPKIPNWCDPLWRSLMEKCWSSDPVSRPSFSEISKELRSMAEIMNIKY